MEDGRLGHGALLARKGDCLILDPMRDNIPLAGVHFGALLVSMSVYLRGAKSWLLLGSTPSSRFGWGMRNPSERTRYGGLWKKGSSDLGSHTAPNHGRQAWRWAI